jgi:O-antigen/teichoic acid export membrane protein
LNETWVLLSVAVAIFGFVIQMRLGLWQFKKNAIQYGVLQVSQSVVNVLLSLLLVIALAQGAAGRIDAQIYATGSFAVISVFLLYRDDLLSFKWRPDQLADVLRFGIPLIPHIAGIFLLSSIDRVVINSKLGLADAGVYMVAVQLTGAMGIVFDAVNKAYVPWLYERLARDQAHEKLQIVRWTYAYFVVVLIAVSLAFVVGPPLTVLIAGERYAEAGKVIGWLALGQAFGGMYLMVTNYTFYAKKTGLLSLSTIVSGAINVALLLALVGQMGLIGAGIAFALAMAIRFFLTWLVAQKCHPMPWFYFLKPNGFL